MKKNPLALTVYRTAKAANDEGSSATPVFPMTVSPPLPAGRSGWDPFEVWRTRIRVIAIRETPRRKR